MLAFRRGVVCVTRHRNPCFTHSKTFATRTAASNRYPDPRYVSLRNAPEGFDVASAVVYPKFLTEEEGKSLIKEASKRLKRRRFENGHWDAVITDYREVEMSTNSRDINVNDAALTIPIFAKTIQQTRRHLANHHFGNNSEDCDAIPSNIQWLPCHAIDLSANGELSAHVDSVKFSGAIVAGISLLSDSIMRLRPSSHEWDSEEQDTPTKLSDDEAERDYSDSNGYVDLYLPQLSLYVLSGMSRYTYTHELLPSGSAFEFLGTKGFVHNDNESIKSVSEHVDVIRGRRLSIIFRDAHRDSSS